MLARISPTNRTSSTPANRTSSIDVVASAVRDAPIDLSDQSSPDGAVTLLFSDIEGSTAMIEQLGEQSWYEMLRDHNIVVRGVTESHGGNVVKSQGDGFMLVFASAHAALHSAIEMERTFAAQAPRRPEEEVRVRIGVHSGYVIADADDFYGRNVVLAARIADSARGGEILVSSTVKQYTETDPSFEFEHRGDFHFKGLHGEHSVYGLAWQ